MTTFLGANRTRRTFIPTYYTTIELRHADILALPTNRHLFVTAQGENTLILPTCLIVQRHIPAFKNYTDNSTDHKAWLVYTPTFDDQGAGGLFIGIGGGTVDNVLYSSADPDGSGVQMMIDPENVGNTVNKPILLYLGATEVTGGDPDNRIRATLVYNVWNILTGRFV